MRGLIATACGDDSIRIFKEDTSAGDIHQPSFNMVTSVCKAHSEDVNSIAWNPKVEGQLASCSDDGSVKLWQFKDND